MVKIQLNLNNFSVSDCIKGLFQSSKELGYDIYVDERGIIRPCLDYCPCCSSSLNDNGYNNSNSSKLKAFGTLLKKGKIACSNPNCDFVWSVPQNVIKVWLDSLSNLIERMILSMGISKNSPSKINKSIQDVFGMTFSDEYIRKKLNHLTGKIKKPKSLYRPSGVYIHDEQFVQIKGLELKRISVLDANNPNVYYDDLRPNRTEETIEGILCRIEEIKNIYAVVLDGYRGAKKAYEDVFGKLILIQNCLFHFAKNVKDAYKEDVGYGKGKSCLPLQHLIGFFSILNLFFGHSRELNELRKLQNELNEHISRINESKFTLAKKQEYVEDYNIKYDSKAASYLREIKKIRRRKYGIKLTLRTEDEAKELFEKAKSENEFPKSVQKQIKRLENDWKNFTHALRDHNIPPTSNKVEQYYAVTLNWIEKKNMQSVEQFYTQQKFSLIKRYNINIFKGGVFSNFLKKTFALIVLFGIG